MNWTAHDISSQFNRVKSLAWLEGFKEAADKFQFPLEILIAIGSRETNLDPQYLRHPGDGGHGFGIMQVDIRSFPQWCASGAWRDARQCIEKGAQVLAMKRDELRHKHTFDNPAVLLHCSISAYNCGAGNALAGFLDHSDPDIRTTGHDYGKDVILRSEEFQKLLTAQETT